MLLIPFGGRSGNTHRFCFIWATLLLLNASQSFASSYYVDGDNGDDQHTGTSTEQAWKTLERANQFIFQPGDRLLLKSGTRYSGQLKPQGSGAVVDGKITPITLGMYGTGPQPRLDGEGKVLDTLLLRNVEYWVVQDLEITNQGTNRAAGRTGVRIVSDGFGAMNYIHLGNLYVHDVNGDLRKSREGCGIFCESRGGNGSHFEDLLIENCHLAHTDRNGICQRGGGRVRSTGVVIRDNLLEDIGGDGIKVWGSQGALIEHNVVRGGRMRCDDAAAGIWPFDSDDTVIQFNEVSGMKGTNDGQGFDSDYRCRNSLFQYNYSHDNDGGFMLICTPGNSYCENTVIRYNLSQNDGINSARIFHFGGGASNTMVYNNVIYAGPQQDVPLVKFTEWNRGSARDTHFYNNIFYAAGTLTYDWGKSTNNVFDHNVFFGHHSGAPNDPHALTNEPPLIKVGSGHEGFESLSGYRLRAHTEFTKGKLIENHGSRDFFGNALPGEKSPTIGICEVR